MFYGKPMRLPKRMLDMRHACTSVWSYVHVDGENDENIKMSSFVQWAIKITSTTVIGYELRTFVRLGIEKRYAMRTLHDVFGICPHP
jgi:hypothetical protein